MIDYLNYGKQVQSSLKQPQNKPKIRVPKPSGGWLEYKLNQTELDYVWSCVNHQEVKENDWTQNLAGNIDSSFLLEDKNDRFFNDTLTPLITYYENYFGSESKKVPIYSSNDNFPPYGMHTWWVNYQKQHEFNPNHNHDGVYSFVIWLKIPYEYEEQNKDNLSNSKFKGSFCFTYSDMFGDKFHYGLYELGKEFEGTMLFFSSKLYHTVYPFYNCEEDRISVSGNISLKV